MSKWSKDFWVDLGERVLSTLLYGVITMLTMDQGGLISGNPTQWWVVVGLPTILATIKGLLANLKDPESGASLVDHPPGPEVQEGGYALLGAIGVGLLVLGIILLFTTLAKVFVVGWIVIIVSIVVGVVLLYLDSNPRVL